MKRRQFLKNFLAASIAIPVTGLALLSPVKKVDTGFFVGGKTEIYWEFSKQVIDIDYIPTPVRYRLKRVPITDENGVTKEILLFEQTPFRQFHYKATITLNGKIQQI